MLISPYTCTYNIYVYNNNNDNNNNNNNNNNNKRLYLTRMLTYLSIVNLL